MDKTDPNKLLSSIAEHTFMDEKYCVQTLINYLDLNPGQADRISRNALKYVQQLRSTPFSKMEGFIQEYSLSNQEGVAIMCLAEALLRIPDTRTANEFIEDRLKNKNWRRHIGQSESTLVNAATWGLLLTGKIVDMSSSSFSLSRMINRMGEPFIQSSIKKAIKLISNEFIMGEELPGALKNATKYLSKGYRLSFDILGESSRTASQAEHYYDAYIKAISNIAKSKRYGKTLYEQHNLSVKLTALHPQVMLRKEQNVFAELMPKLHEIVKLCRDANITISFDAEESYRQDIYLNVLTALHQHKDFRDFEGIGFVVQGYQKRAFHIIDYIAEMAKQLKKRIPMRLVKGAYWDSEIKHAQENGLPGYPVFTRKDFTDISYLACAKKTLSYHDYIYPQFATHNAHTVAAIIEMAGGKEMEFQKLQGMGDTLHKLIRDEGHQSRIYAPVGKYEDLLAYLMRRLLENGANTSFVNLVGNKELMDEQIAANPIENAKPFLKAPLRICLPEDIYKDRKNSTGYEPGMKVHLDEIASELNKFHGNSYEAISIISGKQKAIDPSPKPILMPADNKVTVGKLYRADSKQLMEALDVADTFYAEWSATKAEMRASAIARVGDILHENRYELYSLLMREAGKNLTDAISEVREAIDFARYYAAQSRELCGKPIKLPGYTGESNELSLHGRGVFMCISPWNFPLAIFSGQVLAALAAGNTVLAKPAEYTSLIATFVVKLMHKAGVPKKALHLLIAGGRQISETLLSDNRIKGVCFTGSTATAQSINRQLAARDTAIAPLIAETGGQNCMLVDSTALLEQATDCIINSAFGSIGQRCSALRVLYVQEDIYDNLLELLIGAMEELTIGDTTDLAIDLGPVIHHDPKRELEDHIKEISHKKGCKLLAVHSASKKARHYKSGSFFFPHIVRINSIHDLQKENFGAILHIIPYKAKNLEAVIDEINSTGFGLTFGLQTRIEDKIHYVASRIKAGNFYANRTMIGAQVGTHPFGGENNSGTGFKAGGPHYLLRFMIERSKTINTTAIGGNLELLSG